MRGECRYYKDTHKILGQTFNMLVLQDFEAITPNLLARTIETVEGGGIVVCLLQGMKSLRGLYSMTMVSRIIKIRGTRADEVGRRTFIRGTALPRRCLHPLHDLTSDSFSPSAQTHRASSSTTNSTSSLSPPARTSCLSRKVEASDLADRRARARGRKSRVRQS